MSNASFKRLPCGNMVSSDGTVKSKLGKLIKPQLSNAGYLRVELWANGYGKKHSIHRLVAECFVEKSDNKQFVNHIDGNKLNNDFTNLEWVTRSENQLHAYKIGLQKGYHPKGGKLSESHKAALRGSRWNGFSRSYVIGDSVFTSPNEAAEAFGVSRQTFYNRANSERFPEWKIEIRREVK